jgi:hypothetical protein
MKICSCCKEAKDHEEFTRKIQAKDGLSSACKACTRKRSKNHYLSNKSQYLEKNKRNKEINREKIWNFLKSSCCVDCGEDNPLLLEFDHIKEKNYNISNMIGSQIWSAIELEMQNCEVVCANCHKLRTYSRSKTWYYQQWIKQNADVCPLATNETKG